jgi:hypothetical protein
MKKLMLLIAFALGYMLGARAGRERYEQIMGAFNKVKDDPRVQEKAHQAVDTAMQHAPSVADKVTTAASSAASKVKRSGGNGLADNLNPESTARQENPYPQGDLP